MEQLEQLEQNLIEKVRMQALAIAAADKATLAYETALEQLMVVNPDLRALKTSEINAAAVREAFAIAAKAAIPTVE